MLQQDYLMRLLLQFFEALTRSWEKAEDEEDPMAAADSLEAAIGAATDIDGGILLSLEPESMVSVMQVSGIDPKVSGFIAHGLLLESVYLAQANDLEMAQLRERQARALACAFGVDLPEDPSDFSSLKSQINQEGGFEDEWDDIRFE